MCSMAVSERFIAVCKGNIIDCFEKDKHCTLNYNQEANEFVNDIIISSDNKYLAFITNVSKKLNIYELPDLKCLKTITLPRSASKIRFAVNNTQIFVADKTGDVLFYDLLKEEGGTKILGHLSLLLNVLQTKDEKYIITSDRDEKIRVSNYPNTYNIQTFCLGHKEYVNHLELLPHNDNYLISASGDGTVKFWHYLSGQLRHSIDINDSIDNEQLKEEFRKVMDSEGVEVHNLPLVNFSVTSLSETCSLFAVTIYSYNKLLLYSLKTENDTFIHKLEAELPLEIIPAAFKFYKSCLLLFDDVNLLVWKYKIDCKDDKIELNMVEKIKVFENENVKSSSDIDVSSIKVMFKRKFDNVQEYQERKKQRLTKSS